ncbi:peptide ABC transporter substrate-binding protein, partial [Rhizobium ruizarguesonis]
MNDYTKYLTSRVTAGGLSRREFMGRAMAAGITLAVADKLFTESAQAAEPKRGGHLKLGLEGGA